MPRGVGLVLPTWNVCRRSSSRTMVTVWPECLARPNCPRRATTAAGSRARNSGSSPHPEYRRALRLEDAGVIDENVTSRRAPASAAAGPLRTRAPQPAPLAAAASGFDSPTETFSRHVIRKIGDRPVRQIPSRPSPAPSCRKLDGSSNVCIVDDRGYGNSRARPQCDEMAGASPKKKRRWKRRF